MAVRVEYDRLTDTLDIIVSDAPPRRALVNDLRSFALRLNSDDDPRYQGNEILGFRVPLLSALVAAPVTSTVRVQYSAARDTLTVLGSASAGEWVEHDQRVGGRRLDLLWADDSGENIGARLHGVASFVTGR